MLESSFALELLQRAVRCYVAAGWGEDAGRVYEQLGDFRRAAIYHEQGGRWLEAGQCYEKAEQWQAASRCFMRCSRWERAAVCLEKSGEMIEAGWVWAHELRCFRRAVGMVGGVEVRGNRERLGVELVIARGEIGLEELASAAVRMKSIISMLGAESGGEERSRYEQRALVIAKLLRRPDLVVSVYASGVLAKVHNAEEQWEKWSMEELGDASGIPMDKIEGEKVRG